MMCGHPGGVSQTGRYRQDGLALLPRQVPRLIVLRPIWLVRGR